MMHTVCQTAIRSIQLKTKTLAEKTSLVLRIGKQAGNKSLHFRLYQRTGCWRAFSEGPVQIFRPGSFHSEPCLATTFVKRMQDFLA
jgi:hypothetical protein